jgi:hypothetical protein
VLVSLTWWSVSILSLIYFRDDVDSSNGSSNPYITLEKEPPGKSIRYTKKGRKNVGMVVRHVSIVILQVVMFYL